MKLLNYTKTDSGLVIAKNKFGIYYLLNADEEIIPVRGNENYQFRNLSTVLKYRNQIEIERKNQLRMIDETISNEDSRFWADYLYDSYANNS